MFSKCSLKSIFVVVTISSLFCWLGYKNTIRQRAPIRLNEFVVANGASVRFWHEVHNDVESVETHTLNIKQNQDSLSTDYFEPQIAILDLSECIIDSQKVDELSVILRNLRPPLWQIKFGDIDTPDIVDQFAHKFKDTIVFVDGRRVQR